MRQDVRNALIEWRDPDCGMRVSVVFLRELVRVDDQYIVRRRSVRAVWHYVKRLGVRSVVRKIRSRLAERERNLKAACVGLGTVEAAASDAGFAVGDRVLFFAPNHDPAADRLVLDVRFAVKQADTASGDNRAGDPPTAVPLELEPYVGWTAYSGAPVDVAAVRHGLHQLAPTVPAPRPGQPPIKGAGTGEPVDRIERDRSPDGRPAAVLFGLGNYAKTQIVPPVRRALDLACIHEIDPKQLATARGWGAALDTAPLPRDGEIYDAWFIAGYHHTHADIAITALERGGYAVVEKPLATTQSQLTALERAMVAPGARGLFACFQRRYTPLNAWARLDLGTAPGDPINYHCIVYEIPLPKRHWYNWPSSQSRLTSNGCHWLDHFLFLNQFPGITKQDVMSFSNGDTLVGVQADNGASFSMVLTDHGSERLGVRDYVELRAGRVTVSMTDQSIYRAENSSRVLRGRTVNPVVAYDRMYAGIVERIADGGPGDGIETLASTRLTLGLESQLIQPEAGGIDHPRDVPTLSQLNSASR